MSRERRKKERQAEQQKSVQPINWKYQGDQAEKRSRLKVYYIIAMVFTGIAALMFVIIRTLHGKGYFLINTTIEIWVKYAILLGALIIGGRYFSDLPKMPSSRKIAKVVMALIVIGIMFVGYFNGINQIDTGYFKVGAYKSPDGQHEVLVFKSNKQFIDLEGETNVFTYYVAFPKINSFFCGGSKYEEIGYEDFGNMIWLNNDADAPTEIKWNENGNVFTLTTTGNVDMLSNETEPWDTVIVSFE